MTIQDKSEIQALLIKHIERHDSQAKAVATLNNVSEATIINMRTGKWDSISNEKWRQVGKQLGWDSRKSRMVETMAFNTAILYFDLAKEAGATFSLTGGAGFGKTYTAKWYRDNMVGKNVFFIQCAAYWNKKYFLIEMLQAMGKSPAGMNVYEMMETLVTELSKLDHPVFLVDEVDKLKDEVLLFFITIYNRLNGICGIVWLSTDAIKKRFTKGLRLMKEGYSEMYRRIGRRFIDLCITNYDEVQAICNANDITDAEEINEIFNEYSGDLSRIDRAQLKKIAKTMQKAAKTA